MSRLTEYTEALFHDDPRAHAHVAGRIEYRDSGSSGGGGSSSSGFGSYGGAGSTTTTTKLADAFPVVQGTDGKWYIVTRTGGVVGGPYANQSQANTARDLGRNVGNRFVPGTLPSAITTESATGTITPPFSAESGAYAYAGGEFYPGDWREGL